jgi:hypothetical protein
MPSANNRHANNALPTAIAPPPHQADIPDRQSRAKNPKPTNPAMPSWKSTIRTALRRP